MIGGGPPSERGEVESGPILHDDFRFDPARPVVAGITITGDDQVEIALLKFNFDGDQAFLVTTLQELALVKRLRSDDLRLQRMRKFGQENEYKE